MKPEIFRRCASCGASFRSGALFCPQCGASAQQKSKEEAAPVEQVDGATTNLSLGMTTLVDHEPVAVEDPLQTIDDTPPVAGASSGKPNLDPLETSQFQRTPDAPQPLGSQAVSKEAPDLRKRPGLGPGSVERRMPGVEKLRKGTSIVIGEASFDPSLRFVLVAALLFLLFVVLLILSKWIG